MIWFGRNINCFNCRWRNAVRKITWPDSLCQLEAPTEKIFFEGKTHEIFQDFKEIKLYHWTLHRRQIGKIKNERNSKKLFFYGSKLWCDLVGKEMVRKNVKTMQKRMVKSTLNNAFHHLDELVISNIKSNFCETSIDFLWA